MDHLARAVAQVPEGVQFRVLAASIELREAHEAYDSDRTTENFARKTQADLEAARCRALWSEFIVQSRGEQ